MGEKALSHAPPVQSPMVGVMFFFNVDIKSCHSWLLVSIAKSSFKIRDRMEKFCHAAVYHAFVVPLFDVVDHHLNGGAVGRKEVCLRCARTIHPECYIRLSCDFKDSRCSSLSISISEGWIRQFSWIRITSSPLSRDSRRNENSCIHLVSPIFKRNYIFKPIFIQRDLSYLKIITVLPLSYLISKYLSPWLKESLI